MRMKVTNFWGHDDVPEDNPELYTAAIQSASDDDVLFILIADYFTPDKRPTQPPAINAIHEYLIAEWGDTYKIFVEFLADFDWSWGYDMGFMCYAWNGSEMKLIFWMDNGLHSHKRLKIGYEANV